MLQGPDPNTVFISCKARMLLPLQNTDTTNRKLNSLFGPCKLKKILYICLKAISRRIRNCYNLLWLIHTLPVLWATSSTKQDYSSLHKSKELQGFILVEEHHIRDFHHMYLWTTLFTLLKTVWMTSDMKIGKNKNLTV